MKNHNLATARDKSEEGEKVLLNYAKNSHIVSFSFEVTETNNEIHCVKHPAATFKILTSKIIPGAFMIGCVECIKDWDV